MWKPVIDYARKIFTLQQQTDKNTSDIKDLQRQVRTLTEAVQDLKHENQMARQNEAHERANMALRLENILLRFERRLPPGEAGEGMPRLE